MPDQETQYMQVPSELTFQLIERLSRMETLLSTYVTSQEGHMQNFQKDYDDHENRLRALERTIWIATGFAAAGGGAAGGLLSQFLGG
jgi:hypothetical protein